MVTTLKRGEGVEMSKLEIKGAFTLLEKVGSGPVKKWYGPITFVKKAVMGPYNFFGGSGPNFFCRVNGL